MIKNTYSYNIAAKDIDFRKKLSLASLFNFLLATAESNANENGFGVLELQSKNYTWVLSRLTLEMNRMPVDSDTLSIETWVEDVETIFTTRNFRMLDADGNILGWAASSWAVIDMGTRRPVSLDAFPDLNTFIVSESTPVGIPSRIDKVDGKVANTFKVKYGDVDVNVHANSLRYIQWISDCFDLDFYRAHIIKKFEVNFLQELIFGDEGVVLCESASETDFSFQLVAKEKGPCCRARLVFQPK